MKINLLEVPEDGRAYTWTSKTGEINKVLADLIGSTDYTADFYLRPLSARNFELTGAVKTALPEQCARCGNDIQVPVNAKFHEILIPKQDQPRGGKYAKVNHVSDLPQDGAETSEYENNIFDMGEFLHEMVALAAPFNPACPESKNGEPPICGIPDKDRPFIYDEVMPEDKPESPFSVLKNIKIN